MSQKKLPSESHDDCRIIPLFPTTASHSGNVKNVEYINRKREKYYIKAAPTKSGKIQYCAIKNISKISPNDLLQEIPAGYEFYENPREAKVVLRKIPLYKTTDAEVEIVKLAMKTHANVSDYIVEKAADHIIIYTSNCSINDFDNDNLPIWRIAFQLQLIQRYDDVLRFEKVKNTWHAQRFCYRSIYYGWITIEENKDLQYLAEKYCYHIGKDSLYEFCKY